VGGGSSFTLVPPLRFFPKNFFQGGLHPTYTPPLVNHDYNCNIFTTVGNEEKKQFLMKEYNIPEDHIFSSRDTQFEHQIMSINDVYNLVLNSLTHRKDQ
jgi:hypothetical protein